MQVSTTTLGEPVGVLSWKMYVDQIREGDSYDRLQKCIQVSILDHTYFQDDEKCYRRIALCDTETGKEYTDLLEMHILELSKLPPEQKMRQICYNGCAFWAENAGRISRRWQRIILLLKRHMMY